ncbi:MAG: site-2 protease family protein [Clostridiales bacterium]|jgi:Zn-dependent protease|nr:site-2 protease family protein [Clostridiales bacterium]
MLERILELLITLPAVLLALTFHEYCHALVAYKLGDPTAKMSGRLSLNPAKHIDPIGLICMVFVRFGWAKPVPVNMRYFKKPRLGMAVVALAGPLSNVIFGTVSVFIVYAMILYMPGWFWVSYVIDFFKILASINVGFAVFNILPLPPLDGSRIASLILPPQWYYELMQYEKYIQIALFLLLMFGVLTVPLAYGRSFLMNGIESFVRWILL